MAYTNIDKSSEHFNTVTYSNAGDGAKAVTGVGFQPDFTWLKNRGSAYHHQTFDAVRGATNGALYTSTSNAVDTGYPLTSFDTDGFTTGAQSGNAGQNSASQVSWNWKANGSGSANTDGTISSTVSANATSGFSVGTYSGNSTTGATVGHGLGSAPSMVIVKKTNSTGDWYCYHSGIGATAFIKLNDTAASATNTLWNDTAPTSSVFSMDNNSAVNGSSDSYVFYAFAEKKGFNKFGSYLGNGNADGTFVYTGFKPAWFMVKQTNAAGNSWHIFDNKRDSFNMIEKNLRANLSNAEFDTGVDLDFLSNGVKMRNTDGASNNSGGSTYIYMAFAEAPLVGTNNVPCTAR